MTDGEFVSKVTEEQRQAAIEEHRRQISEGEIPLGPFADQTDEVTDIRDMRDPAAVGIVLAHLREEHGQINPPLSVLHDKNLGWLDLVPIYQGGFDDYMQERQVELETRAADGDRFAAALLRGETLAEDPVD